MNTHPDENMLLPSDPAMFCGFEVFEHLDLSLNLSIAPAAAVCDENEAVQIGKGFMHSSEGISISPPEEDSFAQALGETFVTPPTHVRVTSPQPLTPIKRGTRGTFATHIDNTPESPPSSAAIVVGSKIYYGSKVRKKPYTVIEINVPFRKTLGFRVKGDFGCNVKGCDGHNNGVGCKRTSFITYENYDVWKTSNQFDGKPMRNSMSASMSRCPNFVARKRSATEMENHVENMP